MNADQLDSILEDDETISSNIPTMWFDGAKLVRLEPWKEEPTGEGVGYLIRVSSAVGTSFNGTFTFPRYGYVEANPRRLSTPIDLHGIYGLLDGIGNWANLPDYFDALWQVVAVRLEECRPDPLSFSHYAPRGWVIYSGNAQGAMDIIVPRMAASGRMSEIEGFVDKIYGGDVKYARADFARATGPRNSVSTGWSAYAETTGNQGAAITTNSFAASRATREFGIAAALGQHGLACATHRGAIFLVEWTKQDGLSRVVACKVGDFIDEITILPDHWYTIREGKVVECQAPSPIPKPFLAGGFSFAIGPDSIELFE